MKAEAVTRTRESLASSISSVIALTREVDEASLDDLELALLASDIGSATTEQIITRLRDLALRKGISECEPSSNATSRPRSSPSSALSGQASVTRRHRAAPRSVMMVGVNGAGKTTTSGKLAAQFRRNGNTVLLCAADTFRAAAIEQLEVWAQRSNVDLIKTRQGGGPSARRSTTALAAAKARNTNILLVDTAGRLHTKSDLMKELDKMRRTAEKLIPGAPHQTLLVIDATTGQNGLQQARIFTEAAHVTGGITVLTKLGCWFCQRRNRRCDRPRARTSSSVLRRQARKASKTSSPLMPMLSSTRSSISSHRNVNVASRNTTVFPKSGIYISACLADASLQPQLHRLQVAPESSYEPRPFTLLCLCSLLRPHAASRGSSQPAAKTSSRPRPESSAPTVKIAVGATASPHAASPSNSYSGGRMSLLPLDEQHLTTALDLARSAVGLTSPNPTVGCIIADGETILGPEARITTKPTTTPRS